MEAEYKRDLQNNYLVLNSGPSTEANGYMLKMAEENEIPGLLRLHSSRKDGILYINYEITSKQSLDSIYEKKTMSGQEIWKLLQGIKQAMEQMQSFLLSPLQVLFDPQFIYLESDGSHPCLCYYPGEIPEGQIVLLAEFFLKHLDHEDHDAVSWGYLFYQKAIEKNFSLKTMLNDVLTQARNTLAAEEIHDPEAEYAKNAGMQKNTGMQKDAGIQENAVGYEAHPKRQEYTEESFPDWELQSDEIQPEETAVKQEKKKRKRKKITEVIHPFVLISMVLLLLLTVSAYLLYYITLMQMGAIILLTLAVEILLNRTMTRKNKKKQETDYFESDDQQEMYELLKEEMYEEEPEEKIEETRYLYAEEKEHLIRLVPAGGRKSVGMPDIYLEKELITIGKINTDVILDAPTISRIHAQITQEEGIYYIKDRNSRNGTFYNQERIAPNQRVELMVGDRISFADIEYLIVG